MSRATPLSSLLVAALLALSGRASSQPEQAGSTDAPAHPETPAAAPEDAREEATPNEDAAQAPAPAPADSTGVIAPEPTEPPRRREKPPREEEPPRREPEPIAPPPTRDAELPPVSEPRRDEPAAGAAPRRSAEGGDVGLELDFGINARLGNAAGFEREETLGALYGGAVWLSLARDVTLGLELQHAELGRGSAQSGPNLVDVEFEATTAWLSGRFAPFTSPQVEGFVALRAGIAMQHVDARGVRQSRSSLEPASPFSCRELDGPAIAFGGGLGARFGVGPGFSFVARVDGTAHNLSSEPVGACAPGAGATTSASVGLGLAYTFGAGPSTVAGPRTRDVAVAHTW